MTVSGKDKRGLVEQLRTLRTRLDRLERRNAELVHREQELRESSEQFTTIFDESLIGLYRTTPDGRILMANSALVNILGYSSFEELAERNLENEGYEPDYPRSAFKDRIEREGKVIGLESAWKRSDGTTVYVRESARAIRDESGHILYYQGTVEDVTARKQAEEALRKAHDELEMRVTQRTAELSRAHEALKREDTERKKAEEAQQESEERFHSIFDNASVGMVLVDKDGHVVAVNDEDCRFLGYPREELVGMHFKEFTHPEDVDLDTELYDSVVRGEKDRYAVDKRYVRKDGRVVWGHLGVSLIREGDGAPRYTVIVCEDITDAKRAAERLRESESRYRAVVENAGEGIVVVQDGMLRFVNSRHTSVTGRSQEESTSRPFIEFVHPDDRERVMDIHTRRLRGEQVPPVYELRVIDKEGKTKWLENNGVMIEWDGRPASLNFLRDVTARRDTEEALRRSEERFHLAQQASQTGVWERNLTNNEGYWSEHVETMFEIKSHSFDQRFEQFFECILPDDRERIDREISAAIGEGLGFTTEYRIARPDGSIRWMTDNAQIFNDPEGKPTRLVGTVRDITESKKAEEAIRRQTELLDSIRRAQTLFITGDDPKPVFEALLDTLVEMTNSEYGFIDEVRQDESGQLYKKNLALSNIAWDDESRQLYEKLQPSNFEFRNLNNLAGAPAVTGELVISNDPAHDPRSRGMPKGHPPISSFMGIPMLFGGDLVGVAGVANREGGYNEEIASFLETFISTCASIIQAVRDDRQRQQISQALAESEEEYRRVVEDQTEFIVRWLPGGIRTFVNDSYCDYFGISRDKAIGTSFFPLITDDYLEAVRARIESLTPESPASTGEHQVVRPDGTVGWTQWTDRAIFDEESKLIEFQSVGSDITERKQAQERLADAELRYRTVAEFAHDWEYWENPDGSLRYVSPSCEQITGYPPEQFFSNSDLLSDIILPEDKSLWIQHHNDSFRELGLHEAQFRIRRRDGHICWIEHTCRPVTGADGAFLGFRGSNRDVTERKQAEQALKETTGLLETIFEHTHMLVAYLDPQFNVVRVNRAYAQADEHEPSFYQGKNHFDLFPNAENEQIFRMVMKTGVPYSTYAKPFEYAEHPERGVTYWDWSLVPIKQQDGTVSGLVLTLSNVTERKQAEQALQESEATLSSIFRAAPVGIGLECDQRLSRVNDQVCAMLGYSRDELVGQHAVMFYPSADDYERVRQKNRPQILEMGAATVETQWKRKDGRTIEVLLSTTVLDRADFSKGVTFTALDITERKRAEERLRTRNEIARIFLTVSDEKVFGDVLPTLLEAMQSRHGVFGYINEDGALVCPSMTRDIWEKCQVPDKHIVFPPETWGDSLWCRAIREKKTLYSNEPSRVPEGHIAISRNLAVPIIHEQEVIGLIHVANKATDYDSDDVELLEDIVTHVIAPVIDARILEERQERARRQVEAALRESEQKYSSFVRNFMGIAYRGDIETWTPQFFHGAVEHITGYTEEEFVAGKPRWDEVVHPDDLGRMMAEGSAEKMRSVPDFSTEREYRIIRKDGQIRWLHEMARGVCDESGRPASVEGALYDVTERKEAESALRHSEERHRSMIELAPDIIVVVNRLGVIVSCNSAAEKVTGYTREELVGTHFTKLGAVRFKDVPKLVSVFSNVLRGNVPDPFELNFLRKDRSAGVVQVRVNLLTDGSIQMIATDITDHEKAQRTLRESEERLRILFESAPDGIYLTDSRGRFVDGNRAAEDLIGLGKAEVIGKNLSELGLLSGEQSSRAAANLKKTVAGEPTGPTEYILRRKDGSQIAIEARTFPVKIRGKALALGIARDITERKHTEQKLLEHEAYLKSLASQLSLTEERERHRLATELHDQIGQSLVLSKIKLDQLRKGESAGAMTEALDDVSRCLGQVIADTRTLTFDLSYPILYELGFEVAVAEWLTEHIEEKHGLETDFEDDGHSKPLDDDIRALLFRNVRELLINVVKHAQAGHVKVSVRRADKDICVCVKDDGVGFDPVEAAAMAAKRAEFGLFSIRDRLEQLGGHIEIESGPGLGTKITMHAPLKYGQLDDGTQT
ncbi:MAG: PAS domain S-box protein [Phycisphaerales bacterium]|nr:MAG: PAS domain S-box protein [Phycisphaerales bacterium]